MTVSEKHYVTFHSPGTLFNESSAREIGSWDIKKAVDMSKEITERHGATPFGFTFATYLEEDEGVPDGHGGILDVEPKRINKSAMHFLGGYCLTYSEAVAEDNDRDEVLRSNMKINRMWTVCVNNNSYRSVHAYNGDDVIVNDDGSIACKASWYNDYRDRMNKRADEEDAAWTKKQAERRAQESLSSK
jgi:hypothetical protein